MLKRNYTKKAVAPPAQRAVPPRPEGRGFSHELGDWCGDASDTPICVRCQEHHEQAHSDTVPPLIVKVVQVCGLWQGCAWLPSGVYLYTPAQYLSYADALHAAVALRY